MLFKILPYTNAVCNSCLYNRYAFCCGKEIVVINSCISSSGIGNSPINVLIGCNRLEFEEKDANLERMDRKTFLAIFIRCAFLKLYRLNAGCIFRSYPARRGLVGFVRSDYLPIPKHTSHLWHPSA